MGSSDAAPDLVWIPRETLRLPVELRTPGGFDPAAVETWPEMDGRLEYVDGRLLYMPPCGDIQQDVCAAVVGELYAWAKSHPEFVVAANEAGMILGGDARAADAAVWRRVDAEPRSGGFRRVAPVLAVEVAGRDEREATLMPKAVWYLEHGACCVWLVLPDPRHVVVVTAEGAARKSADDMVSAQGHLPELAIAVSALFAQL